MADVFLSVSWPCTPPVVAPGAYAGWYDSGARQWVFLWNNRAGVGELDVSTTEWTRRYPMEDGRLPADIVLDSNKTAWALACWRAARLWLES